ncbi:lysozyme [Pseudomonas sp. S 311-6]|nr:glycoside hydrolase family 24 [Bordetella sp. J329]MCO7638326.1 lysozyme [Pseudomonas sp. S 311-6]
MNGRQRIAAALLSLSGAGLVGIAAHEGYRGTAYDDGVGVQTIGFGTTAGVKPGDRIEPVRALIRMADDVGATERGLARCIAVPLHQHEWDAYVSWTYNVGTGAACSSTLVRLLNEGQYEAACRQLPRWNRAGGRVLAGLTKRRAEEMQLCLEGRQ